MNNYQIYEEIGKGRFSVVYKGRRKKSVDYYAIASIEKQQRQRVLNSVHFLRALTHPNVIRFHSWYETNNHLWVITEYCTGGDLRSILSLQKSFNERSISVLAADVANGLMHMHSQGVMYCDLKPSNILMDANAQLRFYDFGLAQTVSTSVPGGSAKVGTPSYMAPELFMDDGMHSFASDLWAFGCILYEMYVGTPPFSHTNLQGLMEAISTESFQRIPTASTALNDLLEGLLHKDPAQRMAWSDVVASDFWVNKLDAVPQFPKHEAFANFIASKMGKRDSSSREGERTKKDILRASINAERNLARELRAKGGYQPESAAELGLKVDNEVDFREHEAAQESDDNGASSEQHTELSSPATDLPQPTTHIAFEQPPSRAAKTSALSSPTGAAPATLTSSTVESLLNHASDNHARPIVMNTRIERYVEQKFEANELTFPSRTVSQLKASTPKELETFLTSVYRSLAAASPVLDKFNTLCYFESLCTDTQLANAIINSSIMSLCIKMLHSNPMPSNIRSQLATVMGMLLRYATVIHSELRKTNIINVIMDTMEIEPQPRARRRMMACLGELLFYIATQSPQERAAWHVDTARVASTYLKALQDQDEILRHTAVKAIENITSTNDRSFASMYASRDFVEHLLTIYQAPPQAVRNEYLRASAFCAAVKLAHVDSTLISPTMAVLGPANVGDILATSTPRILQSLLSFLNLYLCKGVALLLQSCNEHHIVRHVAWATPGATDSIFSTCEVPTHEVQQTLSDLMRNRGKFMTGLSSAMEHSSAAIRGKAALAVLLLTTAETTFLSPQSGDIKLFVHLEKLSRDKDSYVANCMQMLYQLFSFFVYVTVSQLSLCHPSSGIGILGDDLVVTLHVFTSQSLRSNITVPDEFLAHLGECVVKLPLFAEFPKHQENVFLLLEAFSQDKALITTHHNMLIKSVLPGIASLLSCQQGDMRFSAVRSLHNIIGPILTDAAIYDPSSPQSTTVPMLNDFVVSLLPSVPQLLSDGEPIPLYTLKLLSACCERSTAILSRLGTPSMVTMLVKFAAGRSENKNTIYVLNLLLRVLQFGGHDLIVHATQQNFVQCIADEITAASSAGSSDQYLDACTEIIFFVLCNAERSQQLASDCVAWLHLLSPVLLPLCAEKQSYSECASSSVEKLAQLYPEARAILLDPSSYGVVRQVLGDYDESSSQVIIPMVKALLLCIRSSSRDGVKAFQQDDLMLVQLQVLAQNTENKTLSQLASEVLTAIYRAMN